MNPEVRVDVGELRPAMLTMPAHLWRTLVNLFMKYGIENYVWFRKWRMYAVTPDYTSCFDIHFTLYTDVSMPVDVRHLNEFLTSFKAGKGYLNYWFNGSLEKPEAEVYVSEGGYRSRFSGEYKPPEEPLEIKINPENEFTVNPKDLLNALKPFRDHTVLRLEENLLRIGSPTLTGKQIACLKVTSKRYKGYSIYSSSKLRDFLRYLTQLDDVSVVHVRYASGQTLIMEAGFRYGRIAFYIAPLIPGNEEELARVFNGVTGCE